MITLNPSTAAELAANLATTRGDAARAAREARALDPIANPEARPYALALVRSCQALHPKLTPARAVRHALEIDRASDRYAADALAWSRARPSTSALYLDRSGRAAALAADLRRFAQTGELARR